MKYTITRARTAKEREAIYRFRYRIFIEEQQKLYIKADHEHKMLYDEIDAFATLYYAQQEGIVIGTVRVMHGAEGDFTQSDIDFFSINNYEKYFSHEELAIADRFIVAPQFRHTRLAYLLMMTTLGGLEQGVKVCFITCLDALLDMYLHFGFRAYAEPYLLENGFKRHKLVLHIDDLEYLEKAKSPIVKYLKPGFYDDNKFAAMANKNAVTADAIW